MFDFWRILCYNFCDSNLYASLIHIPVWKLFCFFKYVISIISETGRTCLSHKLSICKEAIRARLNKHLICLQEIIKSNWSMKCLFFSVVFSNDLDVLICLLQFRFILSLELGPTLSSSQGVYINITNICTVHIARETSNVRWSCLKESYFSKSSHPIKYLYLYIYNEWSMSCLCHIHR